jgi:hypothetical protein
MIFLAPILSAMRFSFAGAIIRSSLEIWYQDGLLFQAGTVTLSANVLPTGARWVTAITRAFLVLAVVKGAVAPYVSDADGDRATAEPNVG